MSIGNVQRIVTVRLFVDAIGDTFHPTRLRPLRSALPPMAQSEVGRCRTYVRQAYNSGHREFAKKTPFLIKCSSEGSSYRTAIFRAAGFLEYIPDRSAVLV